MGAMCGRFVQALDPAEYADYFGAAEAFSEALRPSYNVAPTRQIYAVASAEGQRQLGVFRWGLIPHWAKDPGIGSRMINARAETLAEKPAFRDSFRRRRCLIPADGFGYHRFDSIFTAQYALADTELLAFISQRGSRSEAVELVESYHQFLLANGGTAMESGLAGTAARMVEIFGTYEIFFSQDSMLAGVHGAESKEPATRLAQMLHKKLLEVTQ